MKTLKDEIKELERTCAIVDLEFALRFLPLQAVKDVLVARGYTIEVDPDGTERVIRPNGEVAVIARRKAVN